MPRAVRHINETRLSLSDSEKITINLGYVDPGYIDLVVRNGFCSNRTDFIRTAIRNKLERHAKLIGSSVARSRLELGFRHDTSHELGAARRSRRPLYVNVLGLASIAHDVTPELARAAIASVTVLGALHASAEIKAALTDRTT